MMPFIFALCFRRLRAYAMLLRRRHASAAAAAADAMMMLAFAALFSLSAAIFAALRVSAPMPPLLRSLLFFQYCLISLRRHLLLDAEMAAAAFFASFRHYFITPLMLRRCFRC